MDFSPTHTAGRIFYLIQNALPENRRTSFARSIYRAADSFLPEGKVKFRAMSALSRQEFPESLSDLSVRTKTKVLEAAQGVYGNEWDIYSGSLTHEGLHCFERTIRSLVESFERIDYLEIGSAQGISMSLMGLYLRQLNRLGSLISVDPYYDNGFIEEGMHPATGRRPYREYIAITRRSKEMAQRLYGILGLDVSIIQTTSGKGLVELLKQGRKFHLIFIDGFHAMLTPALDFGLSCHLLHDGGAIMLDDHMGRDVKPIKRLCDRHCEKIVESWKVASYRFRGAA